MYLMFILYTNYYKSNADNFPGRDNVYFSRE